MNIYGHCVGVSIRQRDVKTVIQSIMCNLHSDNGIDTKEIALLIFFAKYDFHFEQKIDLKYYSLKFKTVFPVFI